MKAIETDAVVGEGCTALIILKDTGVKYTAQCGGTGCTHPEAEGYLLGLGDFMQDFDTCEYGCNYMDRDVKYQYELMNAVNEYCEKNGGALGDAIRFDESRITEAQEGWMPVILNGVWPYHNVIFQNDKGFIHNFNCD
jgi:hypothetical protein